MGQRIAKNSLIILLARIVSSGVNFLTLSLIARYLSKDDFGRYQYIIAFVTVFQFAIDFGFSSILVREAAVNKAQAQRTFGVLQTLMGVTSLVAFGVMVWVIRLRSHDSAEVDGVTLAAIATIFFMQCNLSNAIFRAFERLEWEAVTLLSSQCFYVVGIFVVIRADGGLRGIFGVSVVTQAVHYLLSLGICSAKFVRPSLTFDVALAKSLLLAAAPLGIAQIFRRVSWQVDVMLLKAMVGLQFVALFSGAYRIVWGLMILPNALTAALFPAFSNFAQTSSQRLLEAHQRSLKFLIVLSLPIAVVGTVAAEPIIHLLLGQKYVGAKFAGSVFALQIVIWSVVFLFPSAAFAYLFTALHRQRLFTVCSAACLGINVALDVLLIPRYQHVGACVATLTAEAALFTLGICYLSRFVGKVAWSEVALKPLAAAAVMAGVLYPCRYLSGGGLVCGIGTAGFAYLLTLQLLRTFSADELSLLRWRGSQRGD
jgi:O-antigen/teichoic acid export membrane protein